MDAHSEVG